jgi:hypothetical protein
MSFILGRRRSQSDAVTNHPDAGLRKSSRERHSPSGTNQDDMTDPGIFHGLFRKRSDSALSLDSTKNAQKQVGLSAEICSYTPLNRLPESRQWMSIRYSGAPSAGTRTRSVSSGLQRFHSKQFIRKRKSRASSCSGTQRAETAREHSRLLGLST